MRFTCASGAARGRRPRWPMTSPSLVILRTSGCPSLVPLHIFTESNGSLSPGMWRTNRASPGWPLVRWTQPGTLNQTGHQIGGWLDSLYLPVLRIMSIFRHCPIRPKRLYLNQTSFTSRCIQIPNCLSRGSATCLRLGGTRSGPSKVYPPPK